VSTLEAYFRGQKELFKGLAIEELEKDWESYPVFHMDLNSREYLCEDDLVAALDKHLDFWEEFAFNLLKIFHLPIICRLASNH